MRKIITAKLITLAFITIFFCKFSFAETPSEGTVLATVNGKEITLGELMVAVETLPEEYDSVDNNYIFEAVLDQILKQEIMSQKLSPKDAYTRLAVANEIRSIRAKYVIQKYLNGRPTEEEIDIFYKKLSVSNANVEEFDASHILVSSQEEAKEIIKTLADGIDFSNLAKERSIGPSGANGGNLGWFGPGQMVPEFETAVSVLDVGKVSQPVKTEFGWHVIKLNNRRKKELPPIETLRPQIIQDLTQRFVDEIVEKATSESTITINSFDHDVNIIRKTDLLKAASD